MRNKKNKKNPSSFDEYSKKEQKEILKELEEINKREFENFQNQPDPTPEVKRPHRRKTFDGAFLSKKKKARKLSKSEISLKNKIAYQKRKQIWLEKLYKEYREDAGYNPDQIIKTKDGKEIKFLTIENELIDKSQKISANILILQKKREKRFKKYKPRKKKSLDEDFIRTGKAGGWRAWEKSLFWKWFSKNRAKIISFNGFNLKTDYDLAIETIEHQFLEMANDREEQIYSTISAFKMNGEYMTQVETDDF